MKQKYSGRDGLLIRPSVAKELLSKSIARTFKKGGVNVASYETERLSHYHGKSMVHKVRLGFEFPAEVFDVPPVVVVKTYSDEPLNVNDYMAERGMLELSEALTCRDGDRTVRVYPRYFSGEVPECIPYRTLIREYVPQDSLMKIVLEKRGRRENVRWTDINGTISPIALLHTNSPWLEENLGNEITRFSKEYLSENLFKHIERIARFSGNIISEDLRDHIINNLQFAIGKYLFGEHLNSVINGDLSVCPHHTTNSILLDAGGTCVGPITDDLSLYSDPLFEGVLDENGHPMDLQERGKASVREYVDKRKRFAGILHYPNNVEERLRKDFILASWFVAGMRGNIRGASSALCYKYSDSVDTKKNADVAPTSWNPRMNVPVLGQPTNIPLEYLEQEVKNYIHNVLDIMKILRAEDGQLFGALESLIRQALPEDFRINRSVAGKLINGLKEKLSRSARPAVERNSNRFRDGRRTQPIKTVKDLQTEKGTGSLGLQT